MKLAPNLARIPIGFPLTLVLTAALAPAAIAQTTTLVSQSSTGTPGNGHSHESRCSRNGRFVVFASDATNLVPEPTAGGYDIFLRDRSTGLTTLVSKDTTGGPANQQSNEPDISSDGTWIVFESDASDLVSGDTNGFQDIFLYHVASATITRVNTLSNGAQATGGHSKRAAISGNGLNVVFETQAPNLIGPGTNGHYQIVLKNLVTESVTLLSQSQTGLVANAACERPAINELGDIVAFASPANNLVSGDTCCWDVFFTLPGTGFIEIASRSSSGATGNGDSGYPSLSASGLQIAFESYAPNLGVCTGGGNLDVFVRDLAAMTTQQVSLRADGTCLGTATSVAPSISEDGLRVAFASDCTDLVPFDTNGFQDLFVKHLATGAVERVSQSSSGLQGNQVSFDVDFAGDGTVLTFTTAASTLYVNDTNVREDVIAFSLTEPRIDPFCFGDGTGTACPCAAGTAGNGCANSVNPAGGRLLVSGRARISDDSIVLAGSNMPNGTCLYFQGTAQVASGLGTTFGDGLRCVGGAVVRLGTRTNSLTGQSQYPAAGDPPVSVRGLVPPAGGMRYYQIWYRNAAAYCTPDTFNLSNAVAVEWLP